MAQSPCFLLFPFLIPFCPPFISLYLLGTLLAVIGSRPPWSQVARKRHRNSDLQNPEQKQTSVYISIWRKQTEVSVFIFHLQQTNGSCCFPMVLFSVCRILETWRHGDMQTWRPRHEDIAIWKNWRHGDMETSNRNRKPRQFSLISLPLAYHANGSLSFISLLTKKQTRVIHLQTD
jgi:hypothetical protein